MTNKQKPVRRWRKLLLGPALALLMLLSLFVPAFADEGALIVEDGMMQPILQ